MLLKPVSGEDGTEQNIQTINPIGIMQEIAKAIFLEDVLFGKFNS